MSADAAFTSISSALESVCPPPSGSVTACTAAATITGVSYTHNETAIEGSGLGGETPLHAQNSETIETDGELILDVLTSNYTTKAIRDGLILMAAKTFAGSASGKSCSQFDSTPPKTLCSSTRFAGVEYTNTHINADNPAAFLGVELDFHQGMSETLDEVFECVEALEGILGLFTALIPELEPIAIESTEFIELGCEAAMTIGNL
ncbi:MAG: hypothetical protein M1828_000517 [Chrysothrix sp. TS-e1954]|nr:MAG: hypothetical protein M1828_000517 [Chrysothrix sp. TS-e1954]